MLLLIHCIFFLFLLFYNLFLFPILLFHLVLQVFKFLHLFRSILSDVSFIILSYNIDFVFFICIFIFILINSTFRLGCVSFLCIGSDGHVVFIFQYPGLIFHLTLFIAPFNFLLFLLILFFVASYIVFIKSVISHSNHLSTSMKATCVYLYLFVHFSVLCLNINVYTLSEAAVGFFYEIL